MSLMGQKRTSRGQNTMSAITPKADIESSSQNVRYGPIADIGSRSRFGFHNFATLPDADLKLATGRPAPFHLSLFDSSDSISKIRSFRDSREPGDPPHSIKSFRA
jgi:hypothetical protein